MRSGWNLVIYLFIFILLTDGIVWLYIKEHIKKSWINATYWTITTLFLIGVIVYQLTIRTITTPESYHLFSLYIGIFIAFYLPKVLYILSRTVLIPLTLISKRLATIVKIFTATIAIILFIACVYGFTIGRYNYKINYLDVKIDNLAQDLRGVKIVQISDLHLGSVEPTYQGYEKLVNEVNAQKPDLILFTGDMVNNFAEEIEPFIPTLRKLKARYGVYGVTGNHDYGTYTKWNSDDDRAANFRKLLENEKAAGINLLMNQNVKIPIGRDTLLLAGVENWGLPPFPQHGDLRKALEDRGNYTTILLSHDPSHWRAQVLDNNVDLTLSGHTHAMQMGFKIFNYEWSPSKYIYPEYDGLYQEGNSYINVSRGQGYVGLPGRIGLRPTIDVITLRQL